jgi:hypothetical protein
LGVDVGFGVDVGLGVEVAWAVRVAVGVAPAVVGVAVGLSGVGVFVGPAATSRVPSLLSTVMGSLRGSHRVTLSSVKSLSPTALPRKRMVASTPDPSAGGAGSSRVKS